MICWSRYVEGNQMAKSIFHLKKLSEKSQLAIDTKMLHNNTP